MDKLVTELELLTQEAMAIMASIDPDSLSVFMERRGVIMEALIAATERATPQDKEQYKGRIRAVVSLDPIIRQKLQLFRDQASAQLSKIDQGKTQRNAYDSQFDNESYFFDRKK